MIRRQKSRWDDALLIFIVLGLTPVPFLACAFLIEVHVAAFVSAIWFLLSLGFMLLGAIFVPYRGGSDVDDPLDRAHN